MNNKFVWMSTKTKVMIHEHGHDVTNETLQGHTVRIDDSLPYGALSPDPPAFFATKEQLKAWDELDMTGYSVWNTDRQAGKTYLLTKIAEMSPDKFAESAKFLAQV